MALLHHILISYCYSFNGKFYEHGNKVVVGSPLFSHNHGLVFTRLQGENTMKLHIGPSAGMAV
jgi:hypothetical protein